MKLTTICKFSLVSAFYLFGPSSFVFAQVGGLNGFSFLQTPVTARVSGLAGVNITSQDDDVNMFLSNPALLVEELHQHVSVNYLNYLGDIQYSSLAYAHQSKKLGLWGVGLQYFSYGDFEGYDESGNDASDFNARDFALTISHARKVGVFTLGANLKIAQSLIDTYSATAILLDLGGTYKHPEKDFRVGLAVKNIGFVVKDYIADSNTELPFDVQIGTTFRPEYMPFRISITAYNLSRGDIAYYDPFLNSNQDEPGVVDKVLRHITVGAEILLSKNFNVRIGYNHLIRKELRLEETSGGAGFSGGFMFKVKAFEIAYSRRFYHVAGGSNTFTLASDLSTFIKKK